MKQSTPIGWRLWRIGAGAVALACAFLLLRLLEQGSLSGLAPWIRIAWVVTLLLSLLAAPVLIGSGLGLFSSELLAAAGSARAPTARQWLLVYFGMMVVVVTVALSLNRLANVDPLRASLVQGGAIFLFACIGRPWWLFGVIRRTGWFALIRDDGPVRVIVGVAGLFLLALGFLWPPTQ